MSSNVAYGSRRFHHGRKTVDVRFAPTATELLRCREMT